MTGPFPPPAAPGPRICPRLGAEGENGGRQEPILHPSFENRCFAAPQPAPILLTDQATLCLCPAHRACPRLLAARAGAAPTPPAQVKPAAGVATPQPPTDDIDLALRELAAAGDEAERAAVQSRNKWGWIGAGLIFMSSLLCGGFFAAYIGWQLVSRELMAPPPGVVDTVAAVPPVPQPQLYIIVTATSPPHAPAQDAPPVSSAPLVYPPAVTATPPDLSAQAAQGQQLGPAGQSSGVYPLPNVALPQPPVPAGQLGAPEMQLTIPTRRPTPVLDIPTSTPMPDGPTPTPTLVPLAGPPIVLFSAKDAWLFPGKCTTVSWNVANVRAVYYDNIGVNGQGEREECLRDEPGLYTLTVILDGGETRIYTTTVDLVVPTNTPMPTPTFTEMPPPTPTWTPPAPTDTPTPNVRYGVAVAADTTELNCAPGQTCQIDLYLTNTGNIIDNLSFQFLETGAWPAQLCRFDGVCGTTSLTLVNMAPGNRGNVRFLVTVPATDPSNEAVYHLQGVSEGSAKSERSPVLTLLIRAQ